MRHEAPVQTVRMHSEMSNLESFDMICFSIKMSSAQDSRYGQKDTSDQNFDYMFKLLIIGNSSVGKTSFLFRYADDSFTSAFVSTVGIDFKVKTVFKNEKRIKLQIWNQDLVFIAEDDLGNVKGILSSDRLQCKEQMLYSLRDWLLMALLRLDTAGQERYRTITTAYYRGAMGFILMYDITNEESFNAVQDWLLQKAYFNSIWFLWTPCDTCAEPAVKTVNLGPHKLAEVFMGGEKGGRERLFLGRRKMLQTKNAALHEVERALLISIGKHMAIPQIRLQSSVVPLIDKRSTQIKTYSWDNAQVILVGNKCDMEDERVIFTERGKHLAEQLGFEFFETSAKDNINVKQTFERLVDIICDKMSESLETDPAIAATKQNTRLKDTPPPQQPNCGC
ncbi:hypothetical protein Q9233_011121 [Columba guinea]|nr:hypothetical protein Q9233_011121 [Columba guinea]